MHQRHYCGLQKVSLCRYFGTVYVGEVAIHLPPVSEEEDEEEEKGEEEEEDEGGGDGPAGQPLEVSTLDGWGNRLDSRYPLAAVASAPLANLAGAGQLRAAAQPPLLPLELTQPGGGTRTVYVSVRCVCRWRRRQGSRPVACRDVGGGWLQGGAQRPGCGRACRVPTAGRAPGWPALSVPSPPFKHTVSLVANHRVTQGYTAEPFWVGLDPVRSMQQRRSLWLTRKQRQQRKRLRWRQRRKARRRRLVPRRGTVLSRAVGSGDSP